MPSHTGAFVATAVVIETLFSCVAAAQPCSPSWQTGWHARGVVGSDTFAMMTFDDGTGPALYVGGIFSVAGDVAASNVARWNGTEWESLDTGFMLTAGSPVVRAFAAFDDGNGLALYASGRFRQSGSGNVNGIAKWTGSTWASLGITGTDCDGGQMAVYDDDGAGANPPALYAAGAFFGVPGLGGGLHTLIKWNGTTWSDAVAPPGIFIPNVLKVIDTGSGPHLYAGGIDGGSPHAVQRWNGSSWSAVSGEVTGFINDFAFFDHDGDGPSAATLHVAGDFDIAGQPAMSDLARWDGATWHAAGAPNDSVNTLEVADGLLYAGGWFTMIGSVPASRLAAHDGAAWAALDAGGANAVCQSIRRLDFQGTSMLYSAGSFTALGTTAAARIGRLNGGAWQAIGDGEGLIGQATALALHDDGGGDALFVGGAFDHAGGIAASNITKRTSLGWESLGTGVNGPVARLCAYDDQLGGGSDLYVAGNFNLAGGLSVSKIARWTGSAWSSVSGGVAGAPSDSSPVRAMAVFDEDGAGPQRPCLFVAGQVLTAGGSPVSRIARWDGVAWTAVGGTVNDAMAGLAVYNDGTGPALYACGVRFDNNGANHRALARWNGTAWSSVTPAPETGNLNAMFTGPDGLYLRGSVNLPGGVSMNGLLRWNSSGWTNIIPFDNTTSVGAVFDDGSGPKFHIAGGTYGSRGSASTLAYWNGTAFVPTAQRLGPGRPVALLAAQSGDFAGIWCAGNLLQSDTFVSSGIARYLGCIPCPADIAGGDGAVNVSDLLLVIGEWGACDPIPAPCPADVNHDGSVNVTDLLAVISDWGPCS